MAELYFGGCSITAGQGFIEGKTDARLYPNLLSDDIINDAEGGSSNLKIFTKAAKAIIDGVAEKYIVQWSAVHRHWIYPTPDTSIYFAPEDNPHIAWYQQNNHDYANILMLFDFTRILQALQPNTIFVNGLISWTDSAQWLKDLVADANNDHDKFIDNYINNQDLVDWTTWINRWENMYDTKVDDADLDLHPGPLTHKQIADLIRDKLN